MWLSLVHRLVIYVTMTTGATGPEIQGALASKRLIFIRHAQSRFNSPDKKSSDYLTVDADLSDQGMSQAHALASWIEDGSMGVCFENSTNEWPPRADCDESTRSFIATSESLAWVTSNLKRALVTGIIVNRRKALFPVHDVLQFHILSSLQEVSFGIDAQSSTAPFQAPHIDIASIRLYPEPLDIGDPSVIMNASGNDGNINLSTLSPNERINDFCEWTRYRTETMFGVVGHSHWLSRFFKISKASFEGDVDFNAVEEHLASGRSKLGNTGVLDFAIEYLEEGSPVLCRFVPQSTQLVYGRLVNKPSYIRKIRSLLMGSREEQFTEIELAPIFGSARKSSTDEDSTN